MIEQDLRDRIIAAPEVLLDDRDVMRALVAANDRAMGANVVDMRGLAMARLEGRLERLEDTHRAVIAAAYDNLAGTNQIHRAVLRLLEAQSLAEALSALDGEVAQTLRLACVRLAVESGTPSPDPDAVLRHLPEGTVADFLAGPRQAEPRQVTLRRSSPMTGALFGPRAGRCGSEAVLLLDLGPAAPPAMMMLGAEDAGQFRPTQGTDLLAFLAGAAGRLFRRWL